ncbi:hypothetical protein [Enterococcus phage EF-M80]|nr:hypothetical protein [Enterococcus phage SAM-E.f 12]WPH68879.1 hypothetical protein [Enterococcus phage EF-M80]
MIQVFKRLIGNYKTITVDCAYSKNDILELTMYPDGDTLISIRDKNNLSDDDPCVMVRKEDLEKLMEELK